MTYLGLSMAQVAASAAFVITLTLVTSSRFAPVAIHGLAYQSGRQLPRALGPVPGERPSEAGSGPCWRTGPVCGDGHVAQVCPLPGPVWSCSGCSEAGEETGCGEAARAVAPGPPVSRPCCSGLLPVNPGTAFALKTGDLVLPLLFLQPEE